MKGIMRVAHSTCIKKIMFKEVSKVGKKLPVLANPFERQFACPNASFAFILHYVLDILE